MVPFGTKLIRTFRLRFCPFLYTAIIICLTAALQGQALDFYLSPDGDDSRGGESPSAAVRTLKRARDLVRARTPSMSEDIVVHLLEGRYYLSEPVVFDERDGGRNGHRVIYRSHGTQKAVVSGGVPVTQWQETGENGVWKASVEGVGKKIRTFSVNGRSARMGELRGGAYARGAYQTDKGILFDADRFYDNGGDVEITRKILFMQHHAAVEKIERVGDQVAYVMEQPMWSLVQSAPYVAPKCEGAWGIRNARELVDVEGEFYYDRAAGIMYYKPYSDQDMNSADAVAAFSEGLIKVRGSSLQQRVRNLEFWGITFSHDSWQMMRVDSSHGITGTQSVALIVEKSPDPTRFAHPEKGNSDGLELPQAAVEVAFAAHIHFERCTFEHCGSMGISFINGVDSSAIVGNRFREIGSAAINVGHPKHGVLGDHPEFTGGEQHPRSITVTNNHIRSSCTSFLGAQPIVTFFTERLVLSHNDIHKSPYSLITVGYGWQDFNELPADQITCRDNRITNNRLSGSGQRLGDGGAIYALGRMEGVNEFSGNFIYCDPESEGLECRGQNWGLYADQGPKQAVWKNNVVESYEIWMNSLRDPASTWQDNWTTAAKQEWRANQPEGTQTYSAGSRPAEVSRLFEQSGLLPQYREAWDGTLAEPVAQEFYMPGNQAENPRVRIVAGRSAQLVLSHFPAGEFPLTVSVCDAQGRTIRQVIVADASVRSVAMPGVLSVAGVRIVRVSGTRVRRTVKVMQCR